MNLELSEEEREIVHHALKVYLSDLRQEVVKSERHDWKAGLHNEEEVLKRIIEKLA